MIEKSKTCILGCFVALAMCWLGCSDNSVTPTLDQIVVRGYLYAGEPVSDFQLTSSLPIGATDTTGHPITDAGVTLQRNGISYRLIGDSIRPGYFVYPGDDLLVASGDQFNLDVTRGDVHTTAATSVPARPQGVTISLDTLVVHVRTIFGDFRQVYSDDSLVVRWNGSENDLYYSTLKCVDANPQLILDDSLRMFNFVSQPTSQSRYRVPVQDLRWVGRYMVRVYKVNQEYANLYRSREQDSRSLNEPLTNVHNGLGVFSVFASDSVGVYVKLE